jgi:ATP-dependent Clp protease ATP-binding subunit ClpC
LQILDAGRLTDSRGRVANFSNTIVIMTSNTDGIEKERNRIKGFSDSGADNKKDVIKWAEKGFSVALIESIDEIVVFNSLTESDILKIIKMELDAVCSRAGAMDITLSYNQSVVELILSKCLDENKGARLVKRWVQRLVEDKVASLIISKRRSQPVFAELNAENGQCVIKEICNAM